MLAELVNYKNRNDFNELNDYIENAAYCRREIERLTSKLDEEEHRQRRELLQTLNTLVDLIQNKRCKEALSEIRAYIDENCVED